MEIKPFKVLVPLAEYLTQNKPDGKVVQIYKEDIVILDIPLSCKYIVLHENNKLEYKSCIVVIIAKFTAILSSDLISRGDINCINISELFIEQEVVLKSSLKGIKNVEQLNLFKNE